MWRSHASLGEAVIIGAANIICRRQTSFKKRTFVGRQKCVFCWRRERDSNPRVLAHKLISSQPRYDHFDISPYIIKLKASLIFVSYSAGGPVMSCCGARNFLIAFALKISTAATPFCSLHLPPAALANVPTSISLHILLNSKRV